ncbi:MAG: NACHT domain-containing protein [Planctomycetaceae bacterium]|jgi:hypothetical protein|nr:NACHT domain-containing protein [Planctomycetaceae bacterium]MBT6496277.1 NACHT domain-containing protein [Planctomycetaceae bacterium]
MSLTPHPINQYHVFLASPGDVNGERQHVRKFFERLNQTTAKLWGARFEVIDWENYATIGVGRPQELITKQTLEKHKDSLALVVGIMSQRFGSPTGKAESGTEEEFNWAMDCHKEHGRPEIKWFFRKNKTLEIPTDPDEATKALEQWKKVVAFKKRMQNLDNLVFYTEYPGAAAFRDKFEHDLNLWLTDEARPWITEKAATEKTTTTAFLIPTKYYKNIQSDFYRLDIAGIDSERVFDIPLSEIYVRLRVMFDEDAPKESEDYDGGPLDIQTALLRYRKLVIVGDPGSGKSTFLKYIALMLARSFVTGDSSIARDKLSLPEPLPIPIFLSCWDLADFLKQHDKLTLSTLVAFIVDRLTAYGFSALPAAVEKLLEAGNCCLLFDGLDEVPTNAGREAISRLLEQCVKRYGDNRYVVTSRIRAYTGGTMLAGEFTRCDIQPFDADDRAEFIRNWVALLFQVQPEDVETEGSDAADEFYKITGAIEASDRIRPLAVNPLLLTVIAIVHRNRKRLPEQRVDLYDECVDVLLGQRKEAERIQLSGKAVGLDEQQEDEVHEERAWVRKRFAEIALHILSQDGDHEEATKADVVKLLTPRFVDKGATTEEQAASKAESFLRRQELRSGLLVSRHSLSYRFVHLTFQEFLAAWQLSNMDFDDAAKIIQPPLRLAKWFETLQLLGSQWAKESDDKVDRYVEWLLENRGESINEQAPVVALCANIVKDITDVAELRPDTRDVFQVAVEATLDSFREGSGVPVKTQLEILDALGQLGAAVKSHLIDATKASRFQVRRTAIEMLLPYLTDDELFGLTHIFKDGSRHPIMTYVRSLINRDKGRTISLLSEYPGALPTKAAEALGGVGYLLLPPEVSWHKSLAICHKVLARIGYSVSGSIDHDSVLWLSNLMGTNGDQQKILLVSFELAQHADSPYIRERVLRVIREQAPIETTQEFLAERVVHDHAAASYLGGMHSVFGHVVLTRDVDGESPFLDPHKPISHEHIERAAKATDIAEDQIDGTVRSLSEHLGWDITRGLGK